MAPDGGEFPHAQATSRLARTRVLLTGEGRALLLFEGAASQPPASGMLVDEIGAQPWVALSWCVERAGGPDWRGVAILDHPPLGGARLGGDGEAPWQIERPAGVEVGPAALAALAREGGADMPALLGALSRNLIEPATAPESLRAARAFVAGFLRAAADRDGFIEILGHPEGGGLFAQGWSLSLTAGAVSLVGLGPELIARDAEVAHFPREDVMAPASGFCLFARLSPPAETARIDALYFVLGARLIRLDLVPESVLRTEGAHAVAHIGEMYPRLSAPEPTLRAFRRIRRPRFDGVDTLASTPLPIAVGIDTLLRSPAGELLVMGWMLDPLRRIERILVKSSANLYSRIDAHWCALPRPDLHQAFGGDPRFTGLFDPHDSQHGFVARVPSSLAHLRDATLYLELVLDDDSCLFRPLDAVPIATPDPAIRALSWIPPREPELPRIIEEHFAPFLADFPRERPRAATARPIPLGAAAGAREITALIPFRTYAELQPMLALLAGTPDAERLSIALVATRETAAEVLPRLGPAFDFYGLSGCLVLARDGEARAGHLDAALAVAQSPRVLCWLPSALPTGPGWTEALLREAEALPGRQLLSPRMTYEDGSIYFGGAGPIAASRAGRVESGCGWAGYRADRLAPGPARAVASAVQEIALVDRATLDEVGGFSGSLFGDESAHLDLARRLRDAGHGCYCSGSVTFWKLDDAAPAADTPLTILLGKVDAALLARRASGVPQR